MNCGLVCCVFVYLCCFECVRVFANSLVYNVRLCVNVCCACVYVIVGLRIGLFVCVYVCAVV